MTLPTTLSDAGPLALSTHALVKRYGRTTALAGIDLTVPEGSVYVLVGPNGAGKTTTLAILLDIVVADSGTASVMGLDTRTQGARVRAQIGYVPERGDHVYGWMQVGALMKYHAAYYPSWNDDYAAELVQLFELRPEKKLKTLSKGQQRRVQLLLALAHCPPLLVLDEPTDGLDPVMRAETMSALASHMARFPTTMFISTHQVHEVERFADHLAVMRNGRLELQVSRETLRRNLLEYTMAVPDGWTTPDALHDAVVRRNGAGREIAYAIWGEESDIAGRLTAAGALVRDAAPLTLEEAALALLGRPTADSVANRSLTPAAA